MSRLAPEANAVAAPSMKAFRLRPLCGALALALAALSGPAQAQLPSGANVVNGSASVVSNGGQMTIRNSPNAIIDWQSFSIGAANGVRFEQDGASSQILNRVVGNDPSRILGILSSNGRVWLVNPYGVLFGPDARIDVAGLVASTLGITNGDFLAGRFNFDGSAAQTGAQVLNQGRIETPFGGRVWLIGDTVRNEGLIQTPGGSIVLAAGKSVELVDSGMPNVVVRLTAPENEVLNLGSLIASGGSIDLHGGIVNQQGLVRADSVGTDAAGRIVLRAQGDITLSDTSQTSASAGGSGAGGTVVVESTAGTTLVAGQVAATSAQGQGGQVQLLGDRVGVYGQASADASGATGGGAVLVGGDYQGSNPAVRNAQATYVGPDASLRADATGQGDGGKVIVWSDNATRVHGSLSARGGPAGGDGGLVETSGHFLDVAGARVSVGATQGAAGEWLLDPYDLQIIHGTPGGSAGSGADVVFESSVDQSTVYDYQISEALTAGGNVTVQTGAAGTGAANLSMAGTNDPGGAAVIEHAGSSSVRLTLSAHNNIDIAAGARIAATGSGSLAVDFNSDSDGVGDGHISIVGTTISTNGGAVRLYGQSDPVSGFARGSSEDYGVEIRDTTISTGAGDLSIRGAETCCSYGVYLSGSTLESAGDVRIMGFGVYSGLNAYATTISGREVDLRGLATDGTYGGSGVSLSPNVSVSSTTGPISITGDTASTQSPGLDLAGATIGGPQQTGDIILRARNGGSGDSISLNSVGEGGSISASIQTQGSVVLLPGGLNPETGAIVKADDVSIGLGTGAGGFVLDQGELAAIVPGTGSVIVGSDSHTGRITVGAGLQMNTNLTLQNQGVDSAGIGFGAIDLTGKTLTFATRGPLEQESGGAIAADKLLLLTDSNADVSLGKYANQVNRLAVASPASFSFLNSGALVLGAVSGKGFSTSSGAIQTLAAANSSATGDFFVQTGSGALTLAQGISTTAPESTITLVAGTNFSNNGGFLQPAAAGRFLIYDADGPGNTSLLGLPADFLQFNAPYPTAPAQAGNGVLFATPPIDDQKEQESVQTVDSEIDKAVQLATATRDSYPSGGVVDFSSLTGDLFGPVNIRAMGYGDLVSLLESRREYKRKLFADSIDKLEIDPSLADVQPCASAEEAGSGLCRITPEQVAQAQAQNPAQATQQTAPAQPGPEHRHALPLIERKIAVFFGLNDYRDRRIPRLESAIPDANAVAKVFAEQLGYEVRVVRNAGKADIIRTLNQLSLEARPADSVVVYYAGHGYELEKNGAGYWIPADAPVDDPRRWISNNDVSKLLAGYRTRQMAVITDSCYSGAFAREGLGAVGRDVNADDVLQKRSVVVLSSGGDEPVSDEGKDGHSIFAWNLMQAVKSMQNWTPGSTIFGEVRAAVTKEFPQTPQYGAVTAAGHQPGGEYLFEVR